MIDEVNHGRELTRAVEFDNAEAHHRRARGCRAGHLVVTLAAPLAAQGQTPREVDLIVTNGIVVTMDAERRVINPGGRDRRRGHRGVDTPPIAARSRAPDDRRAGQVVMPGLINTHTHAPMVMYRGLADDLALMDWLQKYIFPAEAKTVSPEFVRIGTRLAALEMIESGTTTYADMYYFEEEIARRHARRPGLRGVLGRRSSSSRLPTRRRPPMALARAEAFIQAFHGDELITPAVAPHAVYTLDAATLTASAISPRVSGSDHDSPRGNRGRDRHVAGAHKMSPVAISSRLASGGRHAGRARRVDQRRRRSPMLKRAGRRLAQPREQHEAGQRHRAGPEYLEAGVAVGLAPTAPPATTTSTCSRRCGRRRSPQARHHGSDGDRPRQAALEMATIGGARALGLEAPSDRSNRASGPTSSSCDGCSARQTPMYDPVSHLVYATRGDDVETTIVNGKVLMRDGRC